MVVTDEACEGTSVPLEFSLFPKDHVCFSREGSAHVAHLDLRPRLVLLDFGGEGALVNLWRCNLRERSFTATMATFAKR